MSSNELSTQVKVWLTAAILEEAGIPALPHGRLVDEVLKRFGGTRSTVMTHISARCSATAPVNHRTRFNYLTLTSERDYRLFRDGDPVHPERRGAATHPRQDEVPEAYWHLWRRWTGDAS